MTDDDYVMAPTPAQCADHIEKGGTVEAQWADGTWWKSGRSATSFLNLANQDTPRHGYRLVPTPHRTVTVEIPEADARYWVDPDADCPRGTTERMIAACRKALGEGSQ